MYMNKKKQNMGYKCNNIASKEILHTMGNHNIRVNYLYIKCQYEDLNTKYMNVAMDTH